MPAPDVVLTRRVAAPPARVWELVGDPSRIGELSPECYKVRWKGGATGPVPGAKFVGYNRKGPLRWTTTSTIVTHDAERKISWDVAVAGQKVARWGFRIAADGDGSQVEQYWQDQRTPLASLIGKARTTDSPGHNRRGMEQTLDTLRAAAEG